MATRSDSQSTMSLLMQVGDSLQYEITFVLVVVMGWCIGKLVSRRQRPRTKDKLASHSQISNKATASTRKRSEPRSSHEGRSPVPTKGSFEPNLSTSPAAQLGHIDDIDPTLLRDPSWLVPQVTHMCRTQLRHSLALYRAALEAGLKLKEVPSNDCQQMFAGLVTSAIRTSHMDETMLLLRDLRQQGLGVDTSLFLSVVKLCTSKHLFAECLAVYDFMVEDASFALTDKSLWSCLLFCAIETRACDRCISLFEGLKACGTPSQKDYGNMVRLASVQGNWQLSLKLVQDMRQEGLEVDSVVYNTALATCVSADQVDQAKGLLEQMECIPGLADVITYNTLMKGFTKAGNVEQCYEVFERLQAKNVTPSQVTYGILLDGFINQNQLERAAEIFNTMISNGGAMNTVLFTTLIKGFARAGEVDQAMKVYEQMRTERNVTPDLITFSILIKANCDSDRLEEALKLLESMANLNLRPDEVVFNNLLTGCARGSNAKLGKRLYADMLASGIRPSNATFSILIRVFQQCKALEEAVEMLETEPAKHKIDPEPRIFWQLIQSCIRERQGQRAVKVYEMLVAQSTPSASAHAGVFTTCTKLNMFDTAAEILGIAAARGFKVDSRDAHALLDSAVRKRKTAVAESIQASMAKLGLSYKGLQHNL